MDILHIVIDDERTFESGSNVQYCRCSSSGILALVAAMSNHYYGYGPKVELWLDHDLGLGDTIDPVVKFLMCIVDVGAFIATIKVHSQNASAADGMVTSLRGAGYTSVARTALPTLADRNA